MTTGGGPNDDRPRDPSDGGRPSAPSVRREAVLWGLVGGLLFLVLLTGYELASGWRAPIAPKFGLAVLVGVVVAGLSAGIATRLRENESA